MFANIITVVIIVGAAIGVCLFLSKEKKQGDEL